MAFEVEIVHDEFNYILWNTNMHTNTFYIGKYMENIYMEKFKTKANDS